jgi:hypothetical protein
MALTRELRALAADAATTPSKKRKLDDDTATASTEAANPQMTSTRTAKRKDGPATHASNADEPAKRQKKSAPQRYECHHCLVEKGAQFFPNHTPTSTCEHTIRTCKVCLRKWVTRQITDASYVTEDKEQTPVFGVRCPETCDGVMLNHDVQAATTANPYRLFIKMERRRKAETTPGWRWCMNPRGDAGQVHEKGKVCKCSECGARACVPCDRPVHHGETCAAYMKRVHGDEDTKSLGKIIATTKVCPNPACKVRIEKWLGCGSMICRLYFDLMCWNVVLMFGLGWKCKHTFNWVRVAKG